MWFRKTAKTRLLKMWVQFNSVDQRIWKIVKKLCYELRTDTAAEEHLDILADALLTVSHHCAAVQKENTILKFI